MGACGESGSACVLLIARSPACCGCPNETPPNSLNSLALLYQDQGKYEQAESLFQRALAIYTSTFGPEHPDTKTIQGNYARFLEEKKRKR